MFCRIKVTAGSNDRKRAALGETVATGADFTGVQVRALHVLWPRLLDAARRTPHEEAVPLPRFLVADALPHSFSVFDKAVVRFVFDRELGQIALLQIRSRFGWIQARRTQIDDVTGRVKHGNEDILDRPGDFGLAEMNILPAWTRTAYIVPSGASSKKECNYFAPRA